MGSMDKGNGTNPKRLSNTYRQLGTVWGIYWDVPKNPQTEFTCILNKLHLNVILESEKGNEFSDVPTENN